MPMCVYILLYYRLYRLCAHSNIVMNEHFIPRDYDVSTSVAYVCVRVWLMCVPVWLMCVRVCVCLCVLYANILISARR